MALTVVWEPRKSYIMLINVITRVMTVLTMTGIFAQDVMKEIQLILHPDTYMKEHA